VLVFDQDDGALSRLADRLAGIERKLPEKTISFPGLNNLFLTAAHKYCNLQRNALVV
jgi:hypothetical protein